jgi:hypothetical protein
LSLHFQPSALSFELFRLYPFTFHLSLFTIQNLTPLLIYKVNWINNVP